jgi:hypothetical protein
MSRAFKSIFLTTNLLKMIVNDCANKSSAYSALPGPELPGAAGQGFYKRCAARNSTQNHLKEGQTGAKKDHR